jgi:hypothetical protein
MVKKMVVIVTFALLSLAVTQYQIQKINRETLQTYEAVYIYAKDLDAGTVLSEEDIVIGKINTQWDSEAYVKEASTAIGKQLSTDVKKNALISIGSLAEVKEAMQPANGFALTAVKLTPETAVCWAFEAGDTLALYWVDDDAVATLIGNVFIKSIVSESGASKSAPVYAIVEADEVIVTKIVAMRDEGRFELVRQSGLKN